MTNSNEDILSNTPFNTPQEWGENERRYFEYLKEMAVVRSVLDVLKNEMDFDAQLMEEATRLLSACAAGFLSWEDEAHPVIIKKFQTGLKSGYSCWLDEIETAISKAEMDKEARLW